MQFVGLYEKYGQHMKYEIYPHHDAQHSQKEKPNQLQALATGLGLVFEEIHLVKANFKRLTFNAVLAFP